ncbi:MAG: hypothetical protein IKJ35_08545 [Clostridia bacterium]|nr:hypothetical protein [Clostridia bacterium]
MMKKLFVMLVLVTLCMTLLAGCNSTKPEDPLGSETKSEDTLDRETTGEDPTESVEDDPTESETLKDDSTESETVKDDPIDSAIALVDNVSHKDDLITETYPKEKVVQLKELVDSEESVTFEEFMEDYRVECIRETHQGYYVVLLLEGGENAFVFIDEEAKLFDVLIVNEFKSKNDFEEVKGMTYGEVQQLDPNTIVLSPGGQLITTAHIVQEGCYIVNYLYSWTEYGPLEERHVTSVDFYTNIAWQRAKPTNIVSWIPYILEIDRK